MAEVEKVGAPVTSKPPTARPKRPVKYRDGENTWSGVGTMPAWAKLKGDTLEQYRA
nr:H-NS histone family protein [Bradyrhizobium symbiodeficiens]